MIQNVVWFTTLFFIFLIAIVFLWVGFGASTKKDYEPIVKKWYKVRSIYGVLLIVFMLVVTIYTLRELPFNKPSHVEGADVVEVDVKALQFGYEMEQKEFQVGETVKFNVTTADVTHGFGIYNPEMELIAQTQAMPEYENTIYVTFDEPGTYKVLCLEYCGLAHHLMADEIKIVE